MQFIEIFISVAILVVSMTTWAYFRKKYKDKNKSRAFWIGIFFATWVMVHSLIGAITGIFGAYYSSYIEASRTISMSDDQLMSEINKKMQDVPWVASFLKKDPELSHKFLEVIRKGESYKNDYSQEKNILLKDTFSVVLAADDVSVNKLLQAQLALFRTAYSHSNQLCQNILNNKFKSAAAMAALPEDVQQRFKNTANAFTDAYINGKGKPPYSDSEIMREKLLHNMIRGALTPSQIQALQTQNPSYEQQKCEIRISMLEHMLNNKKDGIDEYRAFLLQPLAPMR